MFRLSLCSCLDAVRHHLFGRYVELTDEQREKLEKSYKVAKKLERLQQKREDGSVNVDQHRTGMLPFRGSSCLAVGMLRIDLTSVIVFINNIQRINVGSCVV